MGTGVLQAVPEGQGSPNSGKVKQTLDHFAKQVKKYQDEQEKLEHEARHLDGESRHEFDKHHSFSKGIASFQVGIVLASISILVRYRALWFLSLAAGAVGIVFLVIGLVI
jgi:hypothetical protein